MRFLIYLGLLLPPVALSAPSLQYDGHLTNGGVPVEGMVSLSIALYAAPDDEAAIWFERHENVVVNQGNFTLYLFSQEDIDATDLGLEMLYMGITVNDTEELQPRERLGAFGRARVAFQALDVRSRDISPSSISINDQLIINNEGEWVGPGQPNGEPGPQGPPGPAGADGQEGAQGPAGPEGPRGPAGLDGQDGAPGPAGADGAQGPAGPAGADGQDGAPGRPGPEGPIGPTGPAGPAGADGQDGAVGPAGPPGPPGNPGEGGGCTVENPAMINDVPLEGTIRLTCGNQAPVLVNLFDSAVCGDGQVEGSEQCDEGAENRNEAGATCRTDCRVQRCGDGIVDPDESCDDGNLVNDDACSNACGEPACGDGIVQHPEQCDDGNNDDGDVCTSACLICPFDVSAEIDTGPFGQNASPRFLAAGDIDGDGDLDFASGNFDGNNISIGLNDGNGNFAVASYGGLDQVTEVALADMDNDGDLDVVGVSNDDNDIFVYTNIGAGIFDDVTTYNSGLNPNDIDTGDLNGDGFLDVAVTNYTSQTTSVFFNHGDGTLGGRTDYETGTSPSDPNLVDLDGDGDLDLAVIATTSDRLRIFKNDGTGVLSVFQDLVVEEDLADLQHGDVDGDGDQDLVIAETNLGPRQIVLLNDGNGTFSTHENGIYGTISSVSELILDDINNDGHLDIIGNYSGNNRAYIFFGVGHGNFAEGVGYGGASSSTDVVTGDFTGDGMTDILASRPNSQRVYVIPRACGNF